MRIGSFDDRNSAIKVDKKLENQAKNHLIINRVKKKQKSDIKSALQSPNIRKQKKKQKNRNDPSRLLLGLTESITTRPLIHRRKWRYITLVIKRLGSITAAWSMARPIHPSAECDVSTQLLMIFGQTFLSRTTQIALQVIEFIHFN